MTLQEALNIAREQKSQINYYSEWPNSYVFSYDDGYESDGGDAPIVVPKNNERCVDFLFALTNTDYLSGEMISERKI